MLVCANVLVHTGVEKHRRFYILWCFEVIHQHRAAGAAGPYYYYTTS